MAKEENSEITDVVSSNIEKLVIHLLSPLIQSEQKMLPNKMVSHIDDISEPPTLQT